MSEAKGQRDMEVSVEASLHTSFDYGSGRAPLCYSKQQVSNNTWPGKREWAMKYRAIESRNSLSERRVIRYPCLMFAAASLWLRRERAFRRWRRINWWCFLARGQCVPSGKQQQSLPACALIRAHSVHTELPFRPGLQRGGTEEGGAFKNDVSREGERGG